MGFGNFGQPPNGQPKSVFSDGAKPLEGQLKLASDDNRLNKMLEAGQKRHLLTKY
jgi:hypothetical protein